MELKFIKRDSQNPLQNHNVTKFCQNHVKNKHFSVKTQFRYQFRNWEWIPKLILIPKLKINRYFGNPIYQLGIRNAKFLSHSNFILWFLTVDSGHIHKVLSTIWTFWTPILYYKMNLSKRMCSTHFCSETKILDLEEGA